MLITDTRRTTAPAALLNSPVAVLDEDGEACRGGCGTTVDFTRNYCDWCFDTYCCTVCGDDLDGAEGCAECWEPRWVKPGEDY